MTFRELRNWWRITGAMHRAHRVESAGGYLEAAELYRAVELSAEAHSYRRQVTDRALAVQKRAECLMRAGKVEDAARALLWMSTVSRQDPLLARVLALQARHPERHLGRLLSEVRSALQEQSLASELGSAFACHDEGAALKEEP
ncbi:MAG: hypothetical protein IT565_14380 [Rhodospirillales bacterium]|nr:hypothetical protein [Rhodospirillales bacterium]